MATYRLAAYVVLCLLAGVRTEEAGAITRVRGSPPVFALVVTKLFAWALTPGHVASRAQDPLTAWVSMIAGDV